MKTIFGLALLLLTISSSFASDCGFSIDSRITGERYETGVELQEKLNRRLEKALVSKGYQKSSFGSTMIASGEVTVNTVIQKNVEITLMNVVGERMTVEGVSEMGAASGASLEKAFLSAVKKIPSCI